MIAEKIATDWVVIDFVAAAAAAVVAAVAVAVAAAAAAVAGCEIA